MNSFSPDSNASASRLGRKNSFQIEPFALALLEDYAWTGNFRELHNFVFKLATEYSDAEIITAARRPSVARRKGRELSNPSRNGDENLSTAANRLILEINPDERLD